MRVTIITTSLAVFATAKAAVIPDASSTDLAIHAADVPSSAISAAALQNPGIAVSFDDAANMAISNDAVVKRDDEEDDPDLEDDDPDLTIDVIKYSSSNCAGEGDVSCNPSGAYSMCSVPSTIHPTRFPLCGTLTVEQKHKLKSGTCKTIDHVFGSYFVRPHEPLPMIGGILHHWDTTFDDPRCTVAV